jgi:hypothetical protein
MNQVKTKDITVRGGDVIRVSVDEQGNPVERRPFILDTHWCGGALKIHYANCRADIKVTEDGVMQARVIEIPTEDLLFDEKALLHSLHHDILNRKLGPIDQEVTKPSTTTEEPAA